VHETNHIRPPKEIYTVVTENKLDHWDNRFGGDLEDPHKLWEDAIHEESRYRLGVMIIVSDIIVNYCDIAPSVVNGRVLYQ
jgi:hypothetical protein